MNKFFSKKTNIQTLRSNICRFADFYGVHKVVFSNRATNVCGSYNLQKKTIFIDLKQTSYDILRTFMHELAHHIASTQMKKWVVYHNDAATPLLSADIKFNIENQIDKLGCELWNKNVCRKKWGRYRYSYLISNKKECIKWINYVF